MAPWVLDAGEREARIGTLLDCPLCDRAEVPAGLSVLRSTPTWDEGSMPGGLRRAHRLSPGVWGRLHVQEGTLKLALRPSRRSR